MIGILMHMKPKRRFSETNTCIDITMLILFNFVFSPIMLYLGISSIYDELELRNKGIIVNAVVIDLHIENNNNELKYEVKYQFSTDGGYTWYSCSDRTGRRNLWCSVTEDQWQIAQSTRQVEVKYLPGKPWINRLVRSDAPSSIIDSVGGVFLGISPWLIYLIIMVSNKTYGSSNLKSWTAV